MYFHNKTYILSIQLNTINSSTFFFHFSFMYILNIGKIIMMPSLGKCKFLRLMVNLILDLYRPRLKSQPLYYTNSPTFYFRGDRKVNVSIKWNNIYIFIKLRISLCLKAVCSFDRCNGNP